MISFLFVVVAGIAVAGIAVVGIAIAIGIVVAGIAVAGIAVAGIAIVIVDIAHNKMTFCIIQNDNMMPSLFTSFY